MSDTCTKRCDHTKLGRKCGPVGSRRHDVPVVFFPHFRRIVSSMTATTGISLGSRSQIALRIGANSLSLSKRSFSKSRYELPQSEYCLPCVQIIPVMVLRPRQVTAAKSIFLANNHVRYY